MQSTGGSGPATTGVAPRPVMPEHTRFCPACDGPVGRGRDGRPGPELGTCPWCGAAFDLRPALGPGDVVVGATDRYFVRGALVPGTRGWLHRADAERTGAPVVLTRLEGPEGRAAGDLAVDDTELLLDLDIPGLVRARDVATAREATGAARHLVLDHVAGTPLAHRRPWPPLAALDALLAALPAISALHARGLLHADLTPSNLLVGPAGVTVMDLGSLRLVDDRTSDVWATSGFVAPEIAPGGAGPSPASEVYALGRTLAVLTMTFDHTRTYALRLPDPATTPLLREYPALDALLRRATDPDPAARPPDVATFRAEVQAVRDRLSQRVGAARPDQEEEDDGDPLGDIPAAGPATRDAPSPDTTRRDRRPRDGVGASTP